MTSLTMRQYIATNTTHEGNAFRDRIASLLSTCYDDVTVEDRLKSFKKADIVFSERHWGRTELVAVECKRYARALTTKDIAAILESYRPMWRGGGAAEGFDRLLIVSCHSLGSDALAASRAYSWCTHLTEAELQESLLGLGSLLNRLAAGDRAETTGTPPFQRLRFEGTSPESSALDEVLAWVGQSGSPAMAVLGGYGQGKTSLALATTQALARAHLEDRAQRIPILVRLGRLTQSTSIEALLAAEFATLKDVDFRFNTMLHLSELGRLVVVLDGFDEMQHGMSAGDFRTNFSELSRLVGPHSKVLLLGRPNVFESIQTREAALAAWRGRTRHLALWDRPAVQNFLEDYLKWLRLRNQTTLDDLQIRSRVAEVLRDVDSELVCRPVHARLVAELAARPDFSFEGFSEHDLYSQFLGQLLRRDAEQKPARQRIEVPDRMRFQQRLAYWAWTRTRQQAASEAFARAEIPEDLLDGLPDVERRNAQAKMGEYIVTTVTDEREPGRLCFTHRSFQEFLVAEHLRTWQLDDPHFALNAAGSALNDGVVGFLASARDSRYLAGWYRHLHAHPEDGADWRIGMLMWQHPEVASETARRAERVLAVEPGWQAAISRVDLLLWGLRQARNAVCPASEAERYRRALQRIAVEGPEMHARRALLYLQLNCMSARELLLLSCQVMTDRKRRDGRDQLSVEWRAAAFETVVAERGRTLQLTAPRLIAVGVRAVETELGANRASVEARWSFDGPTLDSLEVTEAFAAMRRAGLGMAFENE